VFSGGCGDLCREDGRRVSGEYVTGGVIHRKARDSGMNVPVRMNNLMAEPRGFKFFREKLVVAEEVFNTAQAQTRIFCHVT